MCQNENRRQELANKFPEMEEHFQELMQAVNEPQIDHLGETTKEQKKNNLQ